MEFLQSQMQTSQGLAIHSPESNRSSPGEFDGFGTRGYVLYSLGYTVEYWIQQNQAKPGEGFWRIWGS